MQFSEILYSIVNNFRATYFRCKIKKYDKNVIIQGNHYIKMNFIPAVTFNRIIASV